MTPAFFVHGVWMTGRESIYLRRRLERAHGITTQAFHYRSLSMSMDEIVQRLALTVRASPAARVDLIGHSLGGRVIYRAFERGLIDPRRVRRVVFLGTPCVDCRCGRFLGRRRIGRVLLGRAAVQEFLDSPPLQEWGFAPPLGIVAGNHNIGVGRLLGASRSCPGDGTVAVDETRLPGATAHLVLHTTHTGMLLSARVAREVGGFLTDGRFAAQSAASLTSS